MNYETRQVPRCRLFSDITSSNFPRPRRSSADERTRGRFDAGDRRLRANNAVIIIAGRSLSPAERASRQPPRGNGTGDRRIRNERPPSSLFPTVTDSLVMSSIQQPRPPSTDPLVNRVTSLTSPICKQAPGPRRPLPECNQSLPVIVVVHSRNFARCGIVSRFPFLARVPKRVMDASRKANNGTTCTTSNHRDV